MSPDTRPWVIAADWQSRSLLLAEMEARGIEVRTDPGLRWAVRRLLHERVAPPLVLIDTAGDADATPERVERLLAVLAEDGVHPRLVLLAGAFERALWEQAFGSRAVILSRPVTVGEVASAIQSALA